MTKKLIPNSLVNVPVVSAIVRQAMTDYKPTHHSWTPRYDTYSSHGKASCYNCYSDLDGSWWHETHQAHGHGAYAQFCSKCGFVTCYDLNQEDDQ